MSAPRIGTARSTGTSASEFDRARSTARIERHTRMENDEIPVGPLHRDDVSVSRNS
jgi:hypothetical protein